MKAVLVPGFLVLTLLSAAVPLSAHHPWPVSRYRARDREGHGDGIRVGEPAPDDHRRGPGRWRQTEKWLIGGPAINRMEANGWTRTTVKAGDVITGTGYQFADGQKIIRLESVVLASGKEISVYRR